MARYWVGGTDTWNSTAGTKWSTTSGGAGGSAVPTSSDDVFFDANSGTVTVKSDNPNAVCNNLNLTGFTGVLAIDTTASRNILIYGNFTGSASGGTFGSTMQVDFTSTTTGKTITTNGMTMPRVTAFRGVGGEWTLQDNYSTDITLTTIPASQITIRDGTLNTNAKTVTVEVLQVFGTTTKALNITNSTINVGYDHFQGGFYITETGTTITSTGSTIKFNPVGSNTYPFQGGNKTYNNVEFNGDTVFNTTSNTFNDLKVGAGATVTFIAGTTQTVTTFTSSGTAGNLATIQSSPAGSAFTLSDTSGTNAVSYMSIKDSTVSGGATWNAINSTNVSGNTGWNFTTTNNTNFLPFL